MTKQEMKNEAIARMRMLKIYSNAIRDFRKVDLLELADLKDDLKKGGCA